MSVTAVAAALIGSLTLAAADNAARSPSGATVQITPTKYQGLCDASAAVALSPTRFVVANDEDNLLRVFTFDNPAPSPEPLDLSTFLGIGNGKEADIEGAARIGDVVYWLSSHGRNKDGEMQARRLRLFATKVTPDAARPLAPAGAPYTDLLTAFIEPILKEQGFTAAPGTPADPAKAPEKPGSLNIEGLAASGNSLLIGFRNPQPNVGGSPHALIVELKNPAQLIATPAAAPVRGEVFRLDLGRRGVRSLEALPNGQGFIIVAGPFDGNGTFALYRWSGVQASAPTLLTGADFHDFAPEALFVDQPAAAGGATRLALTAVSDDGDAKLEDGTTCKDAPASKQRTRVARISVE
jgi:hypothetical protein